MDELISEIDNNIYQNMKSLSFVRHKKKFLNNKIRSESTTSKLKKKFYSSSFRINSKNNIKEILTKSNSSIAKQFYSSGKNLGIFPKKYYFSIPSKIHLSKLSPKEELSTTSISSLIKSSSTPLKNNTSYSNTNKVIKKIDLNSTNKINFKYNNNYSFNLSFDKNLMIFLNKNNNYSSTYKKNSFLNFVETTRILRKGKIIKNHCQEEALALSEIKGEELNYIDKIEFILKKNKKLFYYFFKNLNSYLTKLSDIKEKENEKLSQLKVKKYRIIHQMEIISDSISNRKEKLNRLKDIKKFLIEVKFEKFIDNISPEIKLKYGFIKEKIKKTKTNCKKRVSFIDKMNQIRRKNSIIIPPKKSHKGNDNFHINWVMEDPRNIPIFDNPEELIYSLNHLNEKLNENMGSYKTCRESVNKFRLNFDEINKNFNKINNKYLEEERKLLNNLNYQKKRNIILNEKLNLLNKSAINEQNSLTKIGLRLKDILLNINSMIKIKDKKNINQWHSEISNHNNFEDENISIEKSYYILKLLEKIIEDLINDKNKFKNNIHLKDEYQKVLNEIEKMNNVKRYILQISLSEKKLEERNNKIFEKMKKNRLGSFLKCKIMSEEKFREKFLKQKSSNKKVKSLNNDFNESKEWFSFNN